MKKLIRIGMMLVMLAVATTISAVPAKRGAVKVQQPDGSEITIMLHGDEWLHFNTTADGYSVVKNHDGFYVYAEKQGAELKATQMVAHDVQQRESSEVNFLAGRKKYLRPEMTATAQLMKQQVAQQEAAKRAARRSSNGNGRRAAQYDYSKFRGLVILIEYNDLSFSREDYPQIAKDMLNKENYTGYDNEVYTGSVRDYFSDNSLGKFEPNFDVYGPYKVDYSQYFVNSTANTAPILNAAINMADADINFKDYDRDNDGTVDMIYFILAGKGANYSGNDERLWWPHRYYMMTTTGGDVRKDGVKLWDYASSVELMGWTSRPETVKIDGIGTICHEFSHVLGLPDFYDTDYEQNGQSNDPGIWSVMSGGSYENDGRTPVGYSLYERWSVGFCDAPTTLTKGSYTLEPLYKNQRGYLVKTPNNGEYFLLENRQNTQFKWDAYLPASGMLVHRVEGEGNMYWEYNKVNAYVYHNYYEVVRANGSYADSSFDLFPSGGKTELSNTSSPATLKTYNGKENELAILNITQNGGNINFTASGYEPKSLTVSPQEIADLGIGITQQIVCKVLPANAETTLTWSSDKPEIATVDQNGLVKGIAAGNCLITVKSNNDLEASCQITVKELTPYTISEFKQEATGQNVLLSLTDAEVLFAYKRNDKTTAYLRDASGCIMLTNAKVEIATNDIVSGTLYVKTGLTNKIPQAIGNEGTNGDQLTIKAGTGAKPREVTIDELTAADYCDLVVVRSTPIERNNGLWLPGETNRARIWAGNFGIKANVPLEELTGMLFDVTGVYATDMLNGQVINEINVIKAVERVDSPTGIKDIHQQKTATSRTYNLNGQRVGNDYKGLVIVNGKKMMKR